MNNPATKEVHRGQRSIKARTAKRRKKHSLFLPVKAGKADESSMWKFYRGCRSTTVHTTAEDCGCSLHV